MCFITLVGKQCMKEKNLKMKITSDTDFNNTN